MATDRWNPGAAAERRQLLFLALGATAIAAASFAFAGHHVFPAILAAVAAVAGCGALAHRWIGRDVYLLFAVLAAAIGGVVSVAIVGLTYLLGIAGFGSVLRAVGVNRLQRNFEKCRQAESMLIEAPCSDADSFRRQS